PCSGSWCDPERHPLRVSASCGPYLAVTLHRVVFSQRVSFPIVRHLDAAQVRMSGKADYKQIKYFAFKEIRCRPHGSNGFKRCTVAVKPHCETEAFLGGGREQVRDDFEPEFGRI